MVLFSVLLPYRKFWCYRPVQRTDLCFKIILESTSQPAPTIPPAKTRARMGRTGDYLSLLLEVAILPNKL